MVGRTQYCGPFQPPVGNHPRLTREEDDQQDGQDEAGRGDADDRDARREVVRPAVVTERGEDPERDADDDRQHEGHDARAGRWSRIPSPTMSLTRPVRVPVRRPEVALDELAGPRDVLHVDRLVQPVLGVEPILTSPGKTLLGVPRTAGNGVHEEEGDDRDREQDRDDPQEPPADIGDHGISLLLIDRSIDGVSMGRPRARPTEVTGRRWRSVLLDRTGLGEHVTWHPASRSRVDLEAADIRLDLVGDHGVPKRQDTPRRSMRIFCACL